MKIFLLNGPGGCGKDTIAAHFRDTTPAWLMKFATPIKRAATAIYCDNDDRLFSSFDKDKETKEKPNIQFFGKSCRDVQIAISEDFLKLQHGEKVFGLILKNSINQLGLPDSDLNIFVSDSGFRPEAEVLVEEFGAENVILIRIHRDGYTFEGDSRDFINLADLGVKEYDIDNPEGDLKRLYGVIEEIVAYTTGETK